MDAIWRTLFFLLALNVNVNHNGKMRVISSTLNNSDNGVFFFSSGWATNWKVKTRHFYSYILKGNVLYLNALLSSWSSQFFFLFFFSVRMLVTGELLSAFKWWDKYCYSLAYIHCFCLAVIFVKFLKILGLSKKASPVFLFANGYLSFVFYFSMF